MGDDVWHVVAAGGLLVVAAINGWLVRAITAGTLRPNLYAGIRTRASMRDDESWAIAHAAAVPWLRRAVAVAVVLAIVTAAVRTPWVTLPALFVPLVLMVLGGIAGDRAARLHGRQ